MNRTASSRCQTWSANLVVVSVLVLLCAPLVKTTAFSPRTATVLPRGGASSTTTTATSSELARHSESVRGGAQLRDVTLQRHRKWRLAQQSSNEATQPSSIDDSIVSASAVPDNSTSFAGTAVAEPPVKTTTSTATTQQQPQDAAVAAKLEPHFLRRIDGIVFVSYLANVMALSLPVLLVPIAATEQISATAAVSAKAASIVVASQVAKISSVASLGGAIGKFVNGFICKEFGSYFCSKTYLAGLGLCSILFSFSTNPTFMSLAFAGMEFFASIQWAALAVMLSNYYAKEPVKLAAALTALGLSSSSGQVLAKVFGMTLSSAFHWRQVAQLGAMVAFGGAALISRAPGRQAAAVEQQNKPPFQWRSIAESLQAVFGSPLFWMLGLAHSMAFVCRGTDRILGTFFQEVAALPPAICGGLTLSITFGLVQGLISGAKKFSKAADLSQKRQFLKKRYIGAVSATFGLAALAHIASTGTLVANRFVMSALVAVVSCLMASNIAFQYFQFPAMIAQKYGDHKAVVISFMDGFGFLLAAPIFASMAKVVPSLGWSSGWTLLGALFGSAAVLMMSSIDPILNLTKTPAEEQKEQQQIATTTTTEPAAAAA